MNRKKPRIYNTTIRKKGKFLIMRGLPLFFLQKDLKNKHEQDKVMIFCLFLQYHCKTNRFTI
ncbi:hypothetical protein DW064_00525 [Segatella copri]|uniref:Uncharacterized protein n=1 Tax=Segatella copri TaxID=165179 RepID=A0AA92V9Z6_9BACT|nr:hypothetical protein DW064_00525 [Segatella copri]